MTITEFLLARIEEDEANAQAASDWVANGPEPRFPWFGSHGEVTGKRFGAALPHIAAMSPARVLAECAAKRAILLENEGIVEGIERLSTALPMDLNQDPDAHWRTATLKHLAAVYQDHPDYRQEWKQD